MWNALNPSAQELLGQLGLAQTEAFSLRDAAELDNSVALYLRYVPTSDIKNRLVTSAEIRSELKSLSAHAENGQLVSCERAYVTIAGGATLVKPGFAYSELVQGHPEALLRRGVCGARLLLSNDHNVRIVTINQRWSAKQGRHYAYLPVGKAETSLTNEVAAHLHGLLCLPRTNLILEWMWTTAGLYFCDARTLHDVSFGDTIPEFWLEATKSVPIRICNYKPAGKGEKKIRVDAFDCDCSEEPDDGDTLVCINDALLSHFVTRALVKRVNVYLKTGALASLW
jgi:hypothetical protein